MLFLAEQQGEDWENYGSKDAVVLRALLARTAVCVSVKVSGKMETHTMHYSFPRRFFLCCFFFIFLHYSKADVSKTKGALSLVRGWKSVKGARVVGGSMEKTMPVCDTVTNR